jgi:PLP dependent protein
LGVGPDKFVGVTDAAVRRAELAENLQAVRERIAGACRKVGRAADEVTLVAVTKTYPASDVAHLAALGVTDVGENRDQEAAAKVAEVARVGAGASVRWHFIGQLQRNKCKSVVTYADVVQSVDSVRLAGTLADVAARHRDRPLDVLVQVSIDGDPSRGGAVSAIGQAAGQGDEEVDLDWVMARVAEADSLRLRGLMAVAPLGWEPERAFAALADIAAASRVNYPAATWLSAGMSGDIEQAIDFGSTHVRVGSALLGNRALLL